MSAPINWLKKELIDVLPAVLYFLLAFSLVNFTEGLMLKDSGIKPASFSRVLIGALIVGKVILVTGLFFFVDVFRGRPLIYNTLWKASLYAITALLFRLGELTLDSFFEYKNILAAQEHLLAEITGPRFWAIQIWLAVLLLIFVASKELVGAIGAARIRQLFLGR
jgi:hypothetical protein